MVIHLRMKVWVPVAHGHLLRHELDMTSEKSPSHSKNQEELREIKGIPKPRSPKKPRETGLRNAGDFKSVRRERGQWWAGRRLATPRQSQFCTCQAFPIRTRHSGSPTDTDQVGAHGLAIGTQVPSAGDPRARHELSNHT